MYKYLILFPVPNPFAGKLCGLMDQVWSITELEPPYFKLLPHVTFHQPLSGIDEERLKNLITSATLQMRRTRITLHALYPFEKHCIVLPVQATRNVAALWVEINNLLARLPEYEHGEYDDDDTLHVTVAAKMSSVFDRSWPKIRDITFEPLTIPLEMIALCRKPVEGGDWREVASFSIPA